MPQLWRIHLKTAAKNRADAFTFCRQNNIIGVGWPVETTSGQITKTEYRAAAQKKYPKMKGWKTALNALQNRMKNDDLCWTRDQKGNYLLGIITDEWSYQDNAENKRHDIVNVRPCQWLRKVTVDHVPGNVVNRFILGGAITKVACQSSCNSSMLLANKLMGEEHYNIDQGDRNLLCLIGPDDCEDLVAFYLQAEKGYYVIPSTCKKNTVKYEYILKHKTTGSMAVVQVKQGEAKLNKDVFSKLNPQIDDVFLFNTMGKYTGGGAPNVHCLSPQKLTDFAKKYQKIMPPKIQMWMEWIG